jgi:DNA-binding transcriptional LysR family regulator
LLLTEQYCAYREMFEKTLMEQGTNPYSGIEIGSVIALKWAVRHGMGTAIVPVIESRPPPPGTILREVQHLDLGLSVGLIRRADDAPGRAAHALLALLRSQLGRDVVSSAGSLAVS